MPFVILVICLFIVGLPVASAQGIPDFEGTALSGVEKTEEDLRGYPTALIVTPTRTAAEESKDWANRLKESIRRSKVGQVRLVDILAIDLPFFIGTDTALEMAKEKVSRRHWANTWLVTGESLEKSLGIDPSSDTVHVYVVSEKGEIRKRVSGPVSEEKVNAVMEALKDSQP